METSPSYFRNVSSQPHHHSITLIPNFLTNCRPPRNLPLDVQPPPIPHSICGHRPRSVGPGLPARPREVRLISWVVNPRTDVEMPEGARGADLQPPSRPPALSTNGLFAFDPSLPVSASFDLIHFPHTNTLTFKTLSLVFIKSFIPGQLSLKPVLQTLVSSNSPSCFSLLLSDYTFPFFLP
jgi:hypothetical protein